MKAKACNIIVLSMIALGGTVDASEPFKVMSYNMLADWLEDVYEPSRHMEWNDPDFPRRDRVGAILDQEDADIIGFQEVTDTQLPDLVSFLPEYDYVVGQPNSFYNAIFYKPDRFDLLDQGIFGLGNGFHHVVWAKLNDSTTNEPFIMADTHLQAGPVEIESERVAQAEVIQQQLPNIVGNLPLILTGDLNIGPGFPSIQTITGEVGPGNIQLLNSCTNWCFDQSTAPTSTQSLDYVLHTSHMNSFNTQVVDTLVDGLWPSDHYPVTSELSFVKDGVRLIPSANYVAVDSAPLDGMGDGAGFHSVFDTHYVGVREDIFFGGTDSHRLITKYQLPNLAEAGRTLQQAKLFLFVEDISESVPEGLSLMHGVNDNDLDREGSDYEAPYVSTGLDLHITSDGIGQYYEFDVTDFLQADYDSDGDNPLAAFRLQLKGGEPSDAPFPWYQIGDGDHVPFLELSFFTYPRTHDLWLSDNCDTLPGSW